MIIATRDVSPILVLWCTPASEFAVLLRQDLSWACIQQVTLLFLLKEDTCDMLPWGSYSPDSHSENWQVCEWHFVNQEDIGSVVEILLQCFLITIVKVFLYVPFASWVK